MMSYDGLTNSAADDTISQLPNPNFSGRGGSSEFENKLIWNPVSFKFGEKRMNFLLQTTFVLNL